LPVLVGPSTAVTPAPGALSLGNKSREESGEEDEKAMISGSFCDACFEEVFQYATHWGPRFKLWNESGTNRARIADSAPLLIRSPQHLALMTPGGTRSSLTRRDK
jgi:hypothetical protein